MRMYVNDLTIFTNCSSDLNLRRLLATIINLINERSLAYLTFYDVNGL